MCRLKIISHKRISRIVINANANERRRVRRNIAGKIRKIG